MKTLNKKFQRIRRHRRIRKNIVGTAERPRLAIFKSNKNIHAQLIDDEKGKTIAAASSLEIKASSKKTSEKKEDAGKTTRQSHKLGLSKIDSASKVGELIASRAHKKNIACVVFDRGGFLFHGRIKNAAEAARKAGLKF